MGINVSTSMGFENYELLRNTAKNILQRSGASSEKAAETVRNLSEPADFVSQSQLSVLRASTQITLNNSLNETLKYLKTHANVKKKSPVLGELWQILSVDNEESQNNPYKGELVDFEIDKNAKNIFAA